jgi:hypothetical protein
MMCVSNYGRRLNAPGCYKNRHYQLDVVYPIPVYPCYVRKATQEELDRLYSVFGPVKHDAVYRFKSLLRKERYHDDGI